MVRTNLLKNLDQCERSFKYIGLLIRGTTGVAGLAVLPDLSQSLVYTWTNDVEYTYDDDSEEEEGEDDRPEWKPSAM